MSVDNCYVVMSIKNHFEQQNNKWSTSPSIHLVSVLSQSISLKLPPLCF